MKTDLTARIQGAGEMETGDDMTFQDIFKSSFLENADAISVLDMAMTMVLRSLSQILLRESLRIRRTARFWIPVRRVPAALSLRLWDH